MLVAPPASTTILFYGSNSIAAPDRVIVQGEGGLIKASPQPTTYVQLPSQRLTRVAANRVDPQQSLADSYHLQQSPAVEKPVFVKTTTKSEEQHYLASFVKSAGSITAVVASSSSEKLLDRRDLPRLQVETNMNARLNTLPLKFHLESSHHDQQQCKEEQEQSRASVKSSLLNQESSSDDSVILNKQLGLLVKPLTEEELMGISLEEAATFMKKGTCPHIRERRVQFVNGLVGFAAQFIYAVWPLTKETSSSSSSSSKSKVLSLRNFVEEVLRRSRTSYVTLNAALYYLNKASQRGRCFTPDQKNLNKYTYCGRRMFLASLVLSTKFLQDRAYTNKTWSKISGLPAREVTACEMALIQWLGWELCIPSLSFAKWQQLVLKRVQLPSSPIDAKISGNCCNNAASSLETGAESTENSPTALHCQFQRYGVLTPHPEPCALGKRKLPLEPHCRTITENAPSNVFPSPAIGNPPEALNSKKRPFNACAVTTTINAATSTLPHNQHKRIKLVSIAKEGSTTNDDDRTSNHNDI